MTNQPVEPAVFSLKEAARYLKMNEPDLRTLVRGGLLPAYRTIGGGAWRIPKAACDEFIAFELDVHREVFGNMNEERANNTS